MRYFIFISGILFFSFGSDIYAQSNSASRLDSIRAANKLRADSIKAAVAARRDSLQWVREQREQKKKELETARKSKSTQRSQEKFEQVDFSREDSLREARKDSLRIKREEESEKRRLLQEEKQNKYLASRKKIIEPLTQEMAGGFRLNSDGWSLFAQRAFLNEAGRRNTFFSIDFSEKKHPKETRTSNDNFSVTYPNEVKPIPYKYGKVNNFYQLKFALGASRALSGKLDKKSVTIHWIYAGGLSVGLLKPYYLDMLVPEGNTYVRRYQKYSESNAEYFLDLNNRGTILGGSQFTKGLGELSIQPGLHARSGFYFDYATTRKSFIGVEIGAAAELYFKEIEIMKNTNNTAYFLSFYADFRFGKRWE